LSESTASLRRKIASAGDLQSVVRTMKALAASSIGQYEKSVVALNEYYHTIELGLGAALRESVNAAPMTGRKPGAAQDAIGAIIFGSDQGLVGQFNEVVTDFALQTLSALTGKPEVWAVGERVHSCLVDAGVVPVGRFDVPNSVDAIAPLVGRIQIESEKHRAKGEYSRVYIFHNRPRSGSIYDPVSQRLLPLDSEWHGILSKIKWPNGNLPQIIGSTTDTVSALIREYLFVSLFRACCESLASENASRLASMQRADKNIADLLVNLNGKFHRLRQTGIDEELFDVISGFEALTGVGKVRSRR
jgi:F-type H+-transporting ATPase subunit gamma